MKRPILAIGPKKEKRGISRKNNLLKKYEYQY
jgi:hypothetical protein